MNVINPLLVDHAQRLHREQNGETHPPHYVNLARVDQPMSPVDVSQRARTASSGEELGSSSTRSANNRVSLDSLSVRLGQVVKAYWWVPAGFAVLVLLRSIMGG